MKDDKEGRQRGCAVDRACELWQPFRLRVTELLASPQRSNSQYGPCRLKAGLKTGENLAKSRS